MNNKLTPAGNAVKHLQSRFRGVLKVANVARLRFCRSRFPNSGESGYLNTSQRCPQSRHAFTLIELVVVMLILATLAGLVAFSLRGIVDRYQLGRAVEAIESFDARARRQARRTREPLETRIDRQRNVLSIEPAANRSRVTIHLPRQVEIAEIRMDRRAVSGGPLEVGINRHGQSATYAVHLKRGNTERWLVVLGTSGQVIPMQDKGEADAILSL